MALLKRSLDEGPRKPARKAPARKTAARKSAPKKSTAVSKRKSA
jgi:hypothetical protein